MSSLFCLFEHFGQYFKVNSYNRLILSKLRCFSKRNSFLIPVRSRIFVSYSVSEHRLVFLGYTGLFGRGEMMVKHLTFIRFTTLVVYSIYFLYFKMVISSWFWLRSQVPHISHYSFFRWKQCNRVFSIPTWIRKEVKIATVTDSWSNVIFWQTSSAIPNAPSEKPTVAQRPYLQAYALLITFNTMKSENL